MNAGSGVYFERTASCCCKYLCINPQLKIAPNKCTIYPCLSNFVKNYSAQLLGNYLAFFSKWDYIFLSRFLRFMCLFVMDELTAECHRQCREVLIWNITSPLLSSTLGWRSFHLNVMLFLLDSVVFQTLMSVPMGHTCAATTLTVSTPWAHIAVRARMDSLEMDSTAQVTHTKQIS